MDGPVLEEEQEESPRYDRNDHEEEGQPSRQTDVLVLGSHEANYPSDGFQTGAEVGAITSRPWLIPCPDGPPTSPSSASYRTEAVGIHGVVVDAPFAL